MYVGYHTMHVHVYHRCVTLQMHFPADSNGQDYLAITQQRTFNPLPGQTIANPVCASFTTIDENAVVLPQTVIVEDVEFFEVTLTSSDSVIIVQELSQARVFIIDNDGKFTLFVFQLMCDTIPPH